MRSAAAAGLVALGLFMSIGLDGITLSGSAVAQDLGQRVKRLENKTSFYAKRVVKRKARFSKRSRAAEACNVIIRKVNVEFANPSELKTWVTYDLTYDLGSDNTALRFFTVTRDNTKAKNWHTTGCEKVTDSLTGQGHVTYEAYCSLLANPGDTVDVYVNYHDGDSACLPDIVGEFVATVVMNKIEMVKPE